jgi:thermitase
LIVCILFTGTTLATTYVDSQVVCQVRIGADADTVAASVGALVAGEIESVNTYLMVYRDSVSVDSIVSVLEKHPDVTLVQPNYMIKINLDQVSQAFVDQTSQAFVDGVEPMEYYENYAETNMSIDYAHLISRGEGQVIAVIDGGLDIQHPLFNGRLHHASFDFMDIDCEPWVDGGTTANHGTFVAGIAARAAPGSALMIIRCFSIAGSGTSFTIAHGICHAARNGADVINMSFGMDYYDQTIGTAIEYAYTEFDVVMIASAGNDGQEINRFPAKHPCVMNIAAVDENDIKADFSNYGTTVSVAASGVGIYSSLCGGDVWGWWCGTSFSAPYVAGLAALVRSTNPSADAEFIMNKIEYSVDNIDALNPNYVYFLGTGRVNFLNAVYLTGDANSSGMVNIGDVVFLVNYVFRDGPGPMPHEAGNVNCDLEVNIGDAVYLLNYIFDDGPDPGCD